MKIEERDGSIVVKEGGVTLGTYVAEPSEKFESPRPYWHPLRSLSGVLVSDYRPVDHSWHWGLSLAISNIDIEATGRQANLWGGVTWVPGEGYRQLNNNGSQVREDLSLERDSFSELLRWEDAEGELFMEEERTFRPRIEANDGGWTLVMESRWRNMTSRPLFFGSPTTAGRPNAGYGGFFLRAAPDFLDSSTQLDGVAMSVDDLQGSLGNSLQCTSPKNKVRMTMTAACDNPVAPTPWFVRTAETAMLCAAPFFHQIWELEAFSEVQWHWSLSITDIGSEE